MNPATPAVAHVPSDSPTSYTNWTDAVAVVDRCRNHENMMDVYRDWANWYGEDSAVQMCLVLRYESDYRLTVVGRNNDATRSWDVGLFQINTRWHCGKIGETMNSQACIDRLKDKDTNIMVARQIYEDRGWSAWYGARRWLNHFHVENITI